jgi:hypothetical protein
LMTFDGTCERGGFQRAPQEIEKIPPGVRCGGQLLRGVHLRTTPTAVVEAGGLWSFGSGAGPCSGAGAGGADAGMQAARERGRELRAASETKQAGKRAQGLTPERSLGCVRNRTCWRALALNSLTAAPPPPGPPTATICPSPPATNCHYVPLSS